jgi:hypothetical protein
MSRLKSQQIKYIDSFLLNILIKKYVIKTFCFCLDLRLFCLDMRFFYLDMRFFYLVIWICDFFIWISDIFRFLFGFAIFLFGFARFHNFRSTIQTKNSFCLDLRLFYLDFRFSLYFNMGRLKFFKISNISE